MKVISGKNIQRNKNWKVILYGKPGVGKTTAATFLKGKTLVLPLDNSNKVLSGTDIDSWKDPKFPDDDDNYFDREYPEESIINFLNDTAEIAKTYDNLVIDNISSFEKDWFVEKGKSSKNHISNELQHYSQWTNYFARIMTTIYMIPNINIVTTAWESQHDLVTETGQTFNQYAPEIRSSVRDGLLGLADVVGRVIINPKTGNRGVILEGNDAIFAKNRIDQRKSTPIEDLFSFGVDQKTKKQVEKQSEKGDER